MPKDKYKIHDVAKDFQMSSKQIIELLLAFEEKERKHSTALTDAELDYVFDVLTQKNQAESFDKYFELINSAAEKAKGKAEQQGEKAAEQQPEQKGEQKAQSKAEEEKKAEPGEKHPDRQKKQPQKAKEQKPVQPRTKGERRRVDIRTSDVDLDKYNERYEDIAIAGGVKQESGVNKQKIKQKSHQYKKQGMRSAKRETEKERLKRIQEERKKKPIIVKIPSEITVGELAARLHMKDVEVIKKLFLLGVMATVNENIDYDTAELVATELGARVEREIEVTIEERAIEDREDLPEELRPRDPVVVVMGHVDHGKTSILDAIRHTAVTQTEAGGITQHIGAYRVNASGKTITFLDTPGHAAFTSMRARGAMATDIAVLVVAADDGIMPQTVEAISHAKAAGVQIIVAINKMDKEGANPERIKQQLTEYNLVPEEWGGDTICVPVSAKTKMGIDDLLENINLVAEVMELKANPNRPAKGVVIEARLDKGRGPIATLLVQNGTLKSGDIVVAGAAVGRVRVMVNENGKKLNTAGPSVPVEIMGLDETPNAGDSFDAAKDEKNARLLVEDRKRKAKEEQFKAFRRVTLDNLSASIKDGEMKELNIIVKADVQGSVEAVTQNLVKLTNDEVKVKVILGGVGAINDSDVMLANASNAIIVGFNVRPDSNAQARAERENVEIRTYRVIYDCIEEIQAAMKGMLAPKLREVEVGKVEVRKIITVSSVGRIAGSYVSEGKIQRNSKVRVVRDGIVIAEDEVGSLRREKDDVKEVLSGFECGICLAKFGDIKEGDIFEAYTIEQYTE